MPTPALFTEPSLTLAASVREAVPWVWWLTPLASLVALMVAALLYRALMRHSEGTDAMVEIAAAVRAGAMAYLRRQYGVVAIAFVVLFVVFFIMARLHLQNQVIPYAFITGGFFSGLCGYIGMHTATNAGARTANAARQSLNAALQVAFRAGSVMGLVVVGFVLLDISVWFLILYYLFPPDFFGQVSPLTQITVVMLSFGFGASTQALFARVGGGIYTKAADCGADLVGKVEAGIPEDDPRNPATIADNVGDNVGDVAGMGADLYESYAGSILATAALGVAAVATRGLSVATQLSYLALPMTLAAVGTLLSVAGIFLVRTDREDASVSDLMGSLNRSINLASVGIAIAALPLVHLFQVERPWQIWLTVIVGLLVGIVIGRSTEYYTSAGYRPTRHIASQAQTGAATLLIEGLSVGMRSTGFPVVSFALGIIVSYYLAGGVQNTLMGLYGVGLAAVAMLSTLGITLGTDAYGSIADNAGGNAEMAGLPAEVRRRTDQLDMVGNTTAATGKGFAIGSAALTALALMAAYLEEVRFAMLHLLQQDVVQVAGEAMQVATMTVQDFARYYDLSLMNPVVLVGLFLGAMAVFVFSSMTMSAVGRTAATMIAEVRRQFRDIPGILEGVGRPDYARCVGIATAGAQREMVSPAVMAIVFPLVVGVVFGVAGVIGLLAGALSTGLVMAIMMANTGGAWDNAKKHIEAGNHGGRNSESHHAAVIGDTVGDPLKDTSGPSLDILIKMMSMASIVFAGLVVSAGVGGLWTRLLSLLP